MKALIALVAISSGACSHDSVPPPQVPAAIEIAARPRPAPMPASFQGVVTSRTSRMVTSTAAGVITQLRVAAGDIVEAGQVLAVGIVSSIQIAAGASTKRGAPILRISNTKRLQLRFALPRDHGLMVAKGTKVLATIAGRPTPLTAVVRSIGRTTQAPLQFAIVDADLGAIVRDTPGLLHAVADVTLAN